MKARSLNIGKKFVAAFAAAAVSLSLLGAGALVAPKAAFADESDSGISLQADGGATNGQIGVNTTRLPVQVEAGTSVNIGQYFSASATGGPWHIDYKITGGEKYASVNKHSGMLLVFQRHLIERLLRSRHM